MRHLEHTEDRPILPPQVDPERYGRLLARKLPAVVGSERENQRLIGELQELDRRHDKLSPEERAYAALLTVLIGSFEDEHYSLDGSTPHTRLQSLMEQHGLRQRDLLGIFHSRCVASEVVRGVRAIGKTQASKLADPFHVPADVFLN